MWADDPVPAPWTPVTAMLQASARVGRSAGPGGDDMAVMDSLKRSLKELLADRDIWKTRSSRYLQALFDINFSEFITIQMLPWIYGLAIVASAGLALYLTVAAFFVSPWKGIVYLVFIGPGLFLICLTAVRVALEFVVAVFRIAENVMELSGITENLEEISDLPSRISLWQMLARPKRPGRPGKTPEGADLDDGEPDPDGG